MEMRMTYALATGATVRKIASQVDTAFFGAHRLGRGANRNCTSGNGSDSDAGHDGLDGCRRRGSRPGNPQAGTGARIGGDVRAHSSIGGLGGRDHGNLAGIKAGPGGNRWAANSDGDRNRF